MGLAAAQLRTAARGGRGAGRDTFREPVEPVRQVLERYLDQRPCRHVRPCEVARQPAPSKSGGDQAQRRERVVGAPDVPCVDEAWITGREVAPGNDDLPRG